MNALVSLNGKFLDADRPYLDGTNRSFKFGDGLFESIRIVEGTPFNLDSHYKRIVEGLDLLKISMADFEKLADLKEQIKELAENNSVKEKGVGHDFLYSDKELEPMHLCLW